MKNKTRFIKQFVSFIRENNGTSVVLSLLLLLGLFTIFFPIIEKYFSCIAEYYFGGEISPKGEFLKIILQIIGGVFLFYGAYLTYCRVQIMEQNSVSDKLRNAIEQLGSDKTSIVIGSLHALNQIAKTNREYVQQIVGIFGSHIRDRMDKEKGWNSLTGKEKDDYRLPTEVQTILDILFRNSGSTVYLNGIIDLSRCKLQRANLNYANLKNAFLNNAQLQGAFLSRANMSNIEMEDANLSFARLIETNLMNSKLSNSCFIGADMKGTKFHFAKLKNTHFEHSYISSVHFERAFLNRANFIGCNMIDVNFSCAELAFSNLSGSRLVRCNFSFSWLAEAKFDGCLMKDIDMRQAELYATQFYGACSKLKSGRNEMDYNFYKTINQRVDKQTELDDSILMGVANHKMIMEIKTKSKKEIEDKLLLQKLLKCIDNRFYTGFDDISKGILASDKIKKATLQYQHAFKLAGVTPPVPPLPQ